MIKEEYSIGDVFNFKGVKLQVVHDDNPCNSGCKGCYFYSTDGPCPSSFKCMAWDRIDNNEVKYKLIEGQDMEKEEKIKKIVIERSSGVTVFFCKEIIFYSYNVSIKKALFKRKVKEFHLEIRFIDRDNKRGTYDGWGEVLNIKEIIKQIESDN